MTIHSGDYVRPNNPSLGLPQGSVWYVACTAGGLKLEAENGNAQSVTRGATAGRRFPARHFVKVVRCCDQWGAVNDAEGFMPDPACTDPSLFLRDVLAEPAHAAPTTASAIGDSPVSVTNAVDPVANAEAHLNSAANAVVVARNLEAERKAELQAAKVVKAKADKESAAKAKAEEAKRQLAARLHSDRCLAEATLELIAEVSRLNNGGSEQVADASIAQHIDQLQALAKSYGYRIAKPSMLAQVVKL